MSRQSHRVLSLWVFCASLAFAAACVVAAPNAQAQIVYPDFADTQGLALVGSAAVAGADLRLTPSLRSQVGAAWLAPPVDVAHGFDTVFRFRMAEPDFLGADGLAFVVQGSGPTALGRGGEDMGFGGIVRSLAVEFDTYRNGGDPSANHVAIQSRGASANSSSALATLAVTDDVPGLADGAAHTVRIVYSPPVLLVFLDDMTMPVLTTETNIASDLALEGGLAWVGFTAATGGSRETHDILDWTFDTSGDVSPGIVVLEPRDGQTLVTDQPVIYARVSTFAAPAGSRWHWLLDSPFPASGPAGGTSVSSGSAATIDGVVYGRSHTLFVALTDGDGLALDSPFARTQVTFTVMATEPLYERRQVLPAGLSIFSPTLRVYLVEGPDGVVDAREHVDGLTARHLIELGATVVVRMSDGQLHAAIGRDGDLLFGGDFAIEADREYVVNMPSATAILLQGVPDATALPSAPSATRDAVWTFAVAGRADPSVALPSGVEAVVRNTRSGAVARGGVSSGGEFLCVLSDDRRQAVVAPGDTLTVGLEMRGGRALGLPVTRRVTETDLRNASTLTDLWARPSTTRLLPNYPNPFNPETWIPFQLSATSEVTARIYDARGSRVRTLRAGLRPTGYHLTRGAALYWDGANDSGERVAGGVYVVELDTSTGRYMRRLVLTP